MCFCLVDFNSHTLFADTQQRKKHFAKGKKIPQFGMDTVEKQSSIILRYGPKFIDTVICPRKQIAAFMQKAPKTYFPFTKTGGKMKLLQEKTSSVNTSDIYSKATLVIG